MGGMLPLDETTSVVDSPATRLDLAREQDQEWRQERRKQLERQLFWITRVIRPSIKHGVFLGWLVLTRPLWLLAHAAGGPGVDLASDWSVLQWCVRYFGCLAALMIPLLAVQQQITQRTGRWENRLRQEQEAVPRGDEHP